MLFFVVFFSCRPVAQTSTPELGSSPPKTLTVALSLDSTGSLQLKVRQTKGPPQEVEVSLYPVHLTAEGRIEILSGEVARQELRSLDDDWTLSFPLSWEEPLRLAVEPLDPISGYPLENRTYLPLLPPAGPLIPGTTWKSSWDRRDRSQGIWLLCHEKPLVCEVTIDDSKLEGFLRF
jgi:hypothetical protein